MKLTANQLRKIIAEEVGKLSKKPASLQKEAFGMGSEFEDLVREVLKIHGVTKYASTGKNQFEVPAAALAAVKQPSELRHDLAYVGAATSKTLTGLAITLKTGY